MSVNVEPHNLTHYNKIGIRKLVLSNIGMFVEKMNYNQLYAANIAVANCLR